MKAHQRTEGETDEWLTPPEIFNALGSFDVDPAAVTLPMGKKLPWPMAQMNIAKEADGLSNEWWAPNFTDGRKPRIWLNPPFNRYQRPKWMEKMADHGNGIMLIPAATETEAFFKYVWNRANALCFLRGRPHFHYIDGTRNKANCGCSIVLVAYGKYNVLALEKSNLGHVVRLPTPAEERK